MENLRKLNFNENYILENNKVVLRPLELSDVDHLLAFSINEPELWKFSLKGANGKENLITYINEAIENRNKKTEYPFIVFDKVQNKYAGSTRFYDIQLAYKTMQLGYTWYGKDFQGTGLNKNCKYLLLEWAFESFGMERIEFRADNRNEKSIAAMKSIGCKVDGILRANVPNNEGGRRDSIVLSILKDEWYKAVKTKLLQKVKNT
jgi:RimJ/RimL family protein N-acetyltransferase